MTGLTTGAPVWSAAPILAATFIAVGLFRLPLLLVVVVNGGLIFAALSTFTGVTVGRSPGPARA